MIKEYAKYEFGKLKVEANFGPEVIPCKVIKFSIGNKSAYITKEDLYALLALYANEKEMDKMIGVRQREMVNIRKMVQVRTKKAIKKGEFITFPIEYPVDKETYELWELENKAAMLTEEEAKAKFKIK